jgi:hypothetical protein
MPTIHRERGYKFHFWVGVLFLAKTKHLTKIY